MRSPLGVGFSTLGHLSAWGSVPSRVMADGSESLIEGFLRMSIPSTLRLNSIGMPLGS